MLQNPVFTAAPLTYKDALEWLFAQTRSGAPRDPARMQRLLAQLALQSPPKVIHVVGTNGKGSVSAMLAAGFEAEGVRAGRFISPHVVEFRERIAVNGRWIAEAEVLDFVRALPALNPAPAFFELSLALALRHFAHEGVEVAVVEAGVGARHDATRALGNVLGVVITNVGRDHLDTLGPALREVAYDKAAAIRPGVPTLTAATGEALAVITEVAAARRSPLFFSTPRSGAPLGPLFRLPEGLPDGTATSTPTRRRNQQLAAATLRLHGVGEAAICQGLRATLPARAERFWLEGKEVVLDGAHNPDAARALLEHTSAPFVLLFGALPKKLGAETLAVLEPHASHIILTNAVPDEASTLRGAGLEFIAEPEAALQAALSRCKGDQQLVVAGSFYLAGRLRPFLLQAAS
jgi:dihydrofolate synthase/folylpolyglutamate synthase